MIIAMLILVPYNVEKIVRTIIMIMIILYSNGDSNNHNSDDDNIDISNAPKGNGIGATGS